jgi:hypothetical protein
MKGNMQGFTALLIILLSITLAHAESETLIIPNNPKWKEECGSCHVAYPPQLLTGGGWHKLMQQLDKHFGVNASMDAKDAQEIDDFLVDNAGLGWQGKASDTGLRITDTPWFIRTHSKIPLKFMNRPKIKGPTHCAACHVKAEKDDWSGMAVEIPSQD